MQEESFQESSYRLALQTAGIGILLLAFIFRVTHTKTQVSVVKDSDKSLQEALKNFTPAPLTPKLTKSAEIYLQNAKNTIVKKKAGKYIDLIEQEDSLPRNLLNFGTTDYFAFGDRKELKDAALVTLDNYGCGSCGPRTFYGTHDVHLLLEKELRLFFDTEDCLVYSDSFSTVSSILGVFSKKKDHLLVDEYCNEAILNGCHLSRGNIHFFKHNDTNSLENILATLNRHKSAKVTIVTEGLFRNDSTISPLREIFNLKTKYDCRLFVDESLSFGVLGAGGKGVTEVAGLEIGTDVDFYVGSLDTFCCSIGGFCVGNKEVVLHQRLMGAGYIFSAAVAPFLSFSAAAAVHLLANNAKDRENLNNLASFFVDTFNSKVSANHPLVSLTGNNKSPIQHLKLDIKQEPSENSEDYKFRQVMTLTKIKTAMEHNSNIFVVIPCNPHELGNNMNFIQPTLKMVITLYHDKESVTALVEALSTALGSLEI